MHEFRPDEYTREDEPYTYVEGSGFVSSLPPHMERRALITHANAAGLSLLLYLLLRSSLPVYVIRIFLLFCPQLRYINAHLLGPDWLVQLIFAICSLLTYAAPFLFYALLVRVPLRKALPMRRIAPWVLAPAIFVALAASVLGAFTSNVINALLRLVRMIPIQPVVTIPAPGGTAWGKLAAMLMAVVSLCVLPALLEEFIYRGILMQSLRRFGDGFALIVSAVLFSLMHQNLAQFPSALFVGLVLGYFVLHTGSIWVGVLLHFCTNLLALFQVLVLPRLSLHTGRLLTYAVCLLCLLFALVSMILLARGRAELFCITPVQSHFTVRQRMRTFFSSPAVLVLLFFVVSGTLAGIQILP